MENMKEQTLFASLDGHRYLALTTYRKNGTPVVTPVWFVKQGEKVFVWTAKDSGKAKRLKNNPGVQLGASNHSGKLLGSVEEGMAGFVPECERPALKKAFRAKYGWQERLFALLWKIKKQQHIYLEIIPREAENRISIGPAFGIGLREESLGY